MTLGVPVPLGDNRQPITLLVRSTNGSSSVVPAKFVLSFVPPLPVKFQPVPEFGAFNAYSAYGTAVNCWRALFSTDMIYDIVREAKLATQNYFRAALQTRVQLVNLPAQKSGVMSFVDVVMCVRCCDDYFYPIFA